MRDDEDTPLPKAITDAEDGPPTARRMADLAAREILSILPLEPAVRARYVGQVGARIRKLQRRTTRSYRDAAEREVTELLQRVDDAERRLERLAERYEECQRTIVNLEREVISLRSHLR